MRLVSWVEAGDAAGVDRWMRATALAQACARRGIEMTWIARDSETARAAATAARVPVRWLPMAADALSVLRERAREADAIVIDADQAVSHLEVATLRRRWPVLMIDPRGNGAESADLVLSDAVDAQNPRWLTGPMFVPLRRSQTSRGVRRVGPGGQPLALICITGPNGEALTQTAIEALLRIDHPRVSAQVIAEHTSALWPQLPSALGRAGFPPAVPLSLDAVATQLPNADFAILRMGVAVYEALAAGVPALVISHGARERAAADRLASHGAIVALGEAPSIEELAGAAAAVAADRRLRVAMARAGRALVDGRGADRIMERLLSVVDTGEGVHVGQ